MTADELVKMIRAETVRAAEADNLAHECRDLRARHIRELAEPPHCWSTRRIGQAVGLSHATIARIVR